MKFTTALFGAAALAGVGYLVSRRMKEKKSAEETVVYAGEKETYGDKLHKASMFAVGAVKTSADKIAEGFRESSSEELIKKGEEAVEQAKEATEVIKKDIEELKNMVVSINISEHDEIAGVEDTMETSPAAEPFEDDIEEI